MAHLPVSIGEHFCCHFLGVGKSLTGHDRLHRLHGREYPVVGRRLRRGPRYTVHACKLNRNNACCVDCWCLHDVPGGGRDFRTPFPPIDIKEVLVDRKLLSLVFCTRHHQATVLLPLQHATRLYRWCPSTAPNYRLSTPRRVEELNRR